MAGWLPAAAVILTDPHVKGSCHGKMPARSRSPLTNLRVPPALTTLTPRLFSALPIPRTPSPPCLSRRMVLADILSPLHAELWGSDILAALGGSAAALVPAAEASGTPDALAVLRAVGAVSAPGLRAAAAAAAGRLAERGVREPCWAASAGSPAVGDCWYYGDERGAQEAVTMSFKYAGTGHVVSVLVDHRRGGRIKDVWVGEAKNVLARARAMSQQDPKLVFTMISAADARARLHRSPRVNARNCPRMPPT
jgi:hypothetical protein